MTRSHNMHESSQTHSTRLWSNIRDLFARVVAQALWGSLLNSCVSQYVTVFCNVAPRDLSKSPRATHCYTLYWTFWITICNTLQNAAHTATHLELSGPPPVRNTKVQEWMRKRGVPERIKKGDRLWLSLAPSHNFLQFPIRVPSVVAGCEPVCTCRFKHDLHQQKPTDSGTVFLNRDRSSWLGASWFSCRLQ